jgi:hypothetical protein
LLCGAYGKGTLYVLTIPDAFADLYKLPIETLAVLRKEINLPVTIECCGRVSLFLYDNETFIIQSFLDRPERVRIRIFKPGVWLVRLNNTEFEFGDFIDQGKIFEVVLLPGHYAAFKMSGKVH